MGGPKIPRMANVPRFRSRSSRAFRSSPSTLDPQHNLAIRCVPIESIKPHPRNARTHSRAHIKALAASLDEFKFTKPIIVDATNTVIAGHGIFEAAKQQGYKTVPVIQRADLSAGQVLQYLIADNRLAELSGWDFEVLALDLKEIDDLGLDVTLTGFDGPQVESIIEDFFPTGAPDDTAPPLETPARPIARRGEFYRLGKHRIGSGDATDAGDVQPLLNGAIPAVMVTDPPYGVEYDPTWRHQAAMNHSLRTRRLQNDDRADWREAWKLFPGDVAYVWHAGLYGAVGQESLEASGFKIRAQLIWVKNRLVIGRGDYHWSHEPCFYAVRNGRPANWCGNRKQTTTWHIATLENAADAATLHPTQKPVEVMRRAIVNSSRRGQAVFDPFLGSGSTLIAAEQTGRIAYGMDIDPVFVDAAIKRWQCFSGKDALLENTDKTFTELASERAASGHEPIIQAARRRPNKKNNK